MGIHPRRLRAMTDEVDQLHHDSMRTVSDQLEEVHLGGLAREHGPARRRFLQQMAAGGAVLSVGSQLVPFGRLLPAAWAQEGAEEPTDLEIAAFAASVELAAAAAYRAAVDSGQLSEPVTALARLFGSHHSAHAGALNDLLAEEVMEPNDALLSQVTSLIEASDDEARVVEVALGIEEAAAATYYAALGTLDQQVAGAVATILPVESQHAVVLATVLERPRSQYLPVLQDDDAAIAAADYPLTGESADDAEDPEPATSTTESPGGGASQEDDNTAGDPGSGDAPDADQGQGE